MLIKVARLGTAVQQVALENGATVADALTAADLQVDNEEIRINQHDASESDVLHNDDIVTLVPKVKGGQRMVKVARLGTAVQEVAVADDATVQNILDAADIQIDNEDVRIDGRTASLGERVGMGNLVTIVPKVKGGE